jgi:tetratricopeptide (TPR) repeat protein
MKNFKFIFFFLLVFNIHFSQTNVNSDEEAQKLFAVASTNFYNLNNKESIKQAEKILTYSLKKQNFELAAKAYNLLGLNFEQFTDYKKAIELYKEGILCASKINNNAALGWLYNNLGGVYSYNNIDINKGTYYFKKAYYHTKNLKNNSDFLVSALNIGANLMELKQYEEGKKYLDIVKDKVLVSNEMDVIVSMYASYSAYYDLYKKDFKNAEKAYFGAIEAGKKDNTPAIRMNLLDIYKSFAEFYEKYNKLEKSVEYYKLYIDLNSEIYNEEQKNILQGKDQSFRLDLINSK